MHDNLNIFDFELDPNEMELIDLLDRNLIFINSKGIDDPNYIYNL